MSNYSAPITATGSLISFDAPLGGVFDSLSVPITPTQDLHGYSQPWPGGGGDNLLPPPEITGSASNVQVSSNGDKVTINGTASAYGQVISANTLTLNAGTYFLKIFVVSGSVTNGYVLPQLRSVNGTTTYVGTTTGASFTLQERTELKFRVTYGSGAVISNYIIQPMIVSGSTAPTAYSPYSNICPISGRTGLSVYRTGVNVWDEQWELGGVNNQNGTLWTATDRIRSKNFIPCLSNTEYYLKCPTMVSTVAFYDADNTFISAIANFAGNATFTTPSNAKYIKFGVAGAYGPTYNNDISINYPSTDHEYHAYNGNTYAVDWTSEAGTVYGGTLDVVTGVLTVTHALKVLNGSEAWGTGAANQGFYTQVNDLIKTVNYNGKIISDKLKPFPQHTNTDYKNGEYGITGYYDYNNAYPNQNWIYAKAAGIATRTDFKTWLSSNPITVVYELATPITYQLTPQEISALVGTNNVWVDTSTVITLIYRLLQVDRQTGATSIGRLAQNLLIANQFGAYSKVIINVTEELYYEAGNDTGRTLELTCPFGTQEMANNIIAMLEGFQYQPYTAERAIIDPAAELGDGLTVNGVYGGIFRLSIKGGAVYNADVSSPADEEIDHEYAFIPNAERKIERRINNLSSELLVQADQISAKVSQMGGNSSSFSWQLLSSGFLLKSGNKTVFQADSSGITVTGQMNATSGYIGDLSNGFLISSRSISNGKSGLSDSNNGVYIGTDGIALGPNFKVDSSGNLTANSGTFTGYVRANMVQSGGDAGYITGGQIGSRAISVGKCSTGINTSLGNADYSADVFSGAVRANYTKANNLFAYGTFDVEGTFLYKGVTVKLITRNVKDSNGNTVTIKYIGSI